MIEQWVFLALVVSILSAVSIQINHHYKIEGVVLTVLRAMFCAILTAPFLFFVEWPSNERFYLIAAGIGVMVVFSDRIIFNASAKYGGRLTSLFVAIKILAGFALWSAIDHTFIVNLVSNKINFIGILSCLILCCIALYHMRKNDASWQAFIYILPAGLILTVADSGGKIAMQDAPLLGGAIMLTFVVNAVVFIFGTPFLLAHQSRTTEKVITVRSLKAAAIMSTVFATMVATITAANATTPNPAYVNALSMLMIVWIILYHKVFKIPDDSSPYAAMAFVISAVGIILFTS